MKNLRNKLGLLVVVLAGLSAPLSLLASGTYCACMPKPPSSAQAGRVDRDKFDLGQRSSTRGGPGQGDAAAQRPRLQAIQTVAGEVAKKKDLTALAGNRASSN
jgi:hypothetical protein